MYAERTEEEPLSALYFLFIEVYPHIGSLL